MNLENLIMQSIATYSTSKDDPHASLAFVYILKCKPLQTCALP